MNEDRKEEEVVATSVAVGQGSAPAIHRSVAPVNLAGNFPDLRNVDMNVVIANAEKYMELQTRLRATALKLTNCNDWVNQDGQPYLEISGTNKVAAGFGISYKDIGESRMTMSDDAGPYIIIESMVEIYFQARSITATGTCSTRDDFFGKKSGNWKPLSEVDLTDIKKKSVTNAVQRGIKSMLGLDFTWEELTEATGGKITQANVTGIKHSSGGQGGKADSTPETAERRTRIWKALVEISHGDVKEASKLLSDLTSFKGRDGNMVTGKTEISKVSEAALGILDPKVVAMYKKHQADLAAGQPAQAGQTAPAATPSGETKKAEDKK